MKTGPVFLLGAGFQSLIIFIAADGGGGGAASGAGSGGRGASGGSGPGGGGGCIGMSESGGCGGGSTYEKQWTTHQQTDRATDESEQLHELVLCGTNLLIDVEFNGFHHYKVVPVDRLHQVSLFLLLIL